MSKPKTKRTSTEYPGVYFILGKSKGIGKTERIYYISYYKNGKRIEEKAGRQSVDNMTPAKANRIRSLKIEGKRQTNAEKRESESEIRLEKNIWTIDKLWNDFYYQKSEEGLKSLKDDYSRYTFHIENRFGKIEPKDLKVSEIDSFRNELSKKLKPATVKQILVLLQRIINHGFRKQLIPPLSFKIQMPKVNNQKTEDLSPEQLKRLLRVLDEDHNTKVADLMKLALFTGMRRSELFNLQWKDIDFDRGFIHLRDPKGGSDQKIPLNDSAREILESRIETESPYIFPGRSEGKLNDISDTVNRIKKLAGLPRDFRPLHGLRHVYASLLASSGQVDMYTLQKLLTHKSPQMTQRYAHLRDDTLRKASNLTGQLINEAVNSINE